MNQEMLIPQSVGARLRGLRQERSELDRQATALVETAANANRDLTPEEREQDDQFAARLEALNDEIHRYERLTAPRPLPAVDPARQRADASPIRSFGEFLQAVAIASDTRMASMVPNSRELLERLTAYQAAASGMSVGAPAGGGYLVRTDWSAAMLQRAGEQAQLLPRCRGIDIGADFDGLEYPYIDEVSRATGSRWGGVQVYWKAEAATVTAKQPKIGKGELRLLEIMGLAYSTERLLRDTTALQSLLSDAFTSEFAFKIDDAIVRGNGAGQMLGFFTGPSMVSVAKETSQVAATVVAANVLKMYARMPARLKPGAVWLIHSDVMTQLPQMVIGDQPVWLAPGSSLNQAPTGLLLGKPVLEIEQCEALGTQGDIFFVNLNEYVVIRKATEGIRADTSMHVRFLYDEMAFRWVTSINGQPIWSSALTPYKGASSMSPYIALDTRA